VLPAAYRLTDGEGFRRAVRTGRRSGASTLVVHLAPRRADAPSTPPLVGFVVSRAVGNAVVRNRVQRRLRHLVRAHLSTLPDGAVLVVRALPPAGRASAAELDADLGRCLGRVLAQLTQPAQLKQPAPATKVSQ
jgi:ribonuclease P protein component